MAKFSAMSPGDVRVGRGMTADRARAPFREALLTMGAGRIELERGDKPGTVKRLLQEASKEMGIRVRSSWEDSAQKALIWKCVGERPEGPGPLEREFERVIGQGERVEAAPELAGVMAAAD